MPALITYKTPVLADWVDYNGHLRDAFYLLIFSFATDAFMDRIGLARDDRDASGHSLFTLEAHINFLHEVKLGESVEVRTQIVGHDGKRVQIYHGLYKADGDVELAASEQMLLHVDLAAGPNQSMSGGSLPCLAGNIPCRSADHGHKKARIAAGFFISAN
ncbi:MAG: thioesterase [Pseudomonas sp.]|uniref:thioesterase family protein n=1 Tax=Pseudomonas sp. TaxID=306 RepID=UPI0011FD1355|nr:thioesterase family protein [Pseudomonas sp.]RZI68056.1 MAG: thioesterase [Pseudomonas sp.]